MLMLPSLLLAPSATKVQPVVSSISSMHSFAVAPKGSTQPHVHVDSGDTSSQASCFSDGKESCQPSVAASTPQQLPCEKLEICVGERSIYVDNLYDIKMYVRSYLCDDNLERPSLRSTCHWEALGA